MDEIWASFYEDINKQAALEEQAELKREMFFHDLAVEKMCLDYEREKKQRENND